MEDTVNTRVMSSVTVVGVGLLGPFLGGEIEWYPERYTIDTKTIQHDLRPHPFPSLRKRKGESGTDRDDTRLDATDWY